VAATTGTAPRSDLHRAYLMALTDWLACAAAGRDEPAARAVRASGDDLVADVAFVATAGHVLDYDDTLADGVAHISATTAPAALVIASSEGLSLRAALAAYAEGYEAMAAVAVASHPALYDRGWHPTAVCGPIGAVTAASRLLELSPEQAENALALALLRAGGTRGAFGTDGKSIQVGLAAAAGVQAALLAKAGATVGARVIHGPLGFERVLGAAWPQPTGDPVATAERDAAITRNWIKLHPSCLGTHSPIDGAARLHEQGAEPQPLQVVVHPVARQAAHLDEVTDGLSAKFSIPYCVAHTLLHGPPRARDFASADPTVSARAEAVTVCVDRALPQFGAVLRTGGRELIRVEAPRGAPEQPLSESQLAAKVTDLAGDELLPALRDLDGPAAMALRVCGLRPQE
jgi:2-methylcitrate dehydratase PrpD